MGGRVNYGPILPKFSGEILARIKLMCVNFRHYINIFKPVMSSIVICRGGLIWGKGHLWADPKKKIGTEILARKKLTCVAFHRFTLIFKTVMSVKAIS